MDQIERGATIFEEHDVESTDLENFYLEKNLLPRWRGC